MPDHYKSPPKKKKRHGSVNPLGKPRGDVYRDTRRPNSPQSGAKGQADVPTANQKAAAASIAAFAGGAWGKSLLSATRSAMRANAAKSATGPKRVLKAQGAGMGVRVAGQIVRAKYQENRKKKEKERQQGNYGRQRRYE